MPKWVYSFTEGDCSDKRLLGGKGAGLCAMTQLGLPVPPGFIITTDACKEFYKRNGELPEDLFPQVLEALRKLEEATGKKLGSPENPLLVSVRSGAPLSMPGMMDTILNLGINDDVVKGLALQSGDERFAYDAYRRFIQMFGRIVMGVDGSKFEHVLEGWKRKRDVAHEADLSAEDMKAIVEEFKKVVREEAGALFPEDPYEQLRMAIIAVFRSWNNKRAIEYREFYKIPHDLGTAVNVVTMVFGNMGYDSGTGVAFTRDPSTGEKRLYGEVLFNAQGEDVVAGIRTPLKIEELRERRPELYEQLLRISRVLEGHYKDMQDIEFTVEKGRLWMLQTRAGKRTAQAAVKIAVDMVDEGLISKADAILRIDPSQVEQLLHPQVDPRAKAKPIARGINASPGAAVGKVVFDADRAKELGGKGERVILVRPETNPDDVGGIIASVGVLTARGGATCVAARTKILTKLGFMTAEELYEAVMRGEPVSILSYDSRRMRPCWRKVISAGYRRAHAIRISVSQTGRAKGNTLDVTPDHRFLVFKGRKLVKEPISEVLRNARFVTLVDYIPHASEAFDRTDLAYLVGALSSDGYVEVTEHRGRVVFTQKEIPEKLTFIKAVLRAYESVFGEKFKRRVKASSSTLRGRKIEGTASDFTSSRKGPASVLAQLQNSESWLLGADEDALWNFLAGLVDGDGSFNPSSNRVNLYVGEERVLRQVIIASLRLGILPQVTINRDIYNVQFVDGLDQLLSRTKRVKGELRRAKYKGVRYFPAREILGDCAHHVNHEGKILFYITHNRLISDEVLKRRVLPLAGSRLRKDLKKILSAKLRTYRVKKVEELGETCVYNFEVDADDELDKNFVAFTERYTPLLISNSHAAVVSRGLGKPAVVGCEALQIDLYNREFRVGPHIVREGSVITINGTTGEVFLGEVPLVTPELSLELKRLLSWADEFRRLGVYANADYPQDAKKAREFGAEGIGLCRTERMFREAERLDLVRQVIFAETPEELRDALSKLEPIQRSDFKEILKAMDGLPVVIRLLDLPLHEFLPRYEEVLEEVIRLRVTGEDPDRLRDKEKVLKKIEALREANPMIGHRGVRIGVTRPEIYETQVRAIFSAACELKREGYRPIVEVMLPLVSHASEIRALRGRLEAVAKQVMGEYGVSVPYKFGTMIETPRAALTADEVAKYADFFSFGTNDLTQMTFGYSRDDAEGKFLTFYIQEGLLSNDPFQTLDTGGVGKLVEMGTKLGRSANPNLEIGICGEHGGDPATIEFCHKIGIDYVSASPFRIPVARLAAAQAALRERVAKIEVSTTV